IAAAVDLVASRGLLRAHVGRRPDDRSRLCERLRLPRDAEGAGDPEVRDDGGPARKQDVLRLDVAVHHAVAVRVGQRSRHLRRDATAAQLPLDGVASGERVAEGFEQVGHESGAPGEDGSVAYTAAQPPARTGRDSFQTERAALGYRTRL